ncbi:hypothetical protein Nepgr_015905 [Nepenthes gracilis]|uniref:Uncharacterized protein n=1 Tax=Nepenthes gracilis TaxID=150966 RepID=A0AAD3SNT1_NEPGR|nr:hypothetical protein Nepgr_015905 [Nepenthes gracilis]
MAGTFGASDSLPLNQHPIFFGSASSSTPPFSDFEISSIPKSPPASSLVQISSIDPPSLFEVSIGSLIASDYPQLVSPKATSLPLSMTSKVSYRKMSGVRALREVKNPCPESALISVADANSATLGRLNEPNSKPPMDSSASPPQLSWSSVGVQQSFLIKCSLMFKLITNGNLYHSSQGDRAEHSEAQCKTATIFRPPGSILSVSKSLRSRRKVNKKSHASAAPSKAVPDAGNPPVSNTFDALLEIEMDCQNVDSSVVRNRDGVEDELLQIKTPICNSVHAKPGIDDYQFPENGIATHEFEYVISLRGQVRIPTLPPSSSKVLNQFASMFGRIDYPGHADQYADDISAGRVSSPVFRNHQDGGNIGSPLVESNDGANCSEVAYAHSGNAICFPVANRFGPAHDIEVTDRLNAPLPPSSLSRIPPLSLVRVNPTYAKIEGSKKRSSSKFVDSTLKSSRGPKRISPMLPSSHD